MHGKTGKQKRRITQVGLRHVFKKYHLSEAVSTSKVISYVTEAVDPLTYNEIDGIWDFVGECTWYMIYSIYRECTWGIGCPFPDNTSQMEKPPRATEAASGKETQSKGRSRA